MADVTLPYTFTSNTTISASQMNANLQALRDGVNDIDLANLSSTLTQYVAQAGDLKATARSSAPTGWLLCDGSAVSRTTYAALFSAIGTTYGTGDGSTTFNVPDLRGRVPMGVDGAAGRIASNDALGQSGGSQTHTLTEAELPTHSHPGYNGYGFVMDEGGSATHFADPVPGAVGNYNWNPPGSSPFPDEPTTTGDTGSSSAHNNLQPYQVVNWVIKT